MRNGIAQSLIDASSIVSASLLSAKPFKPDAYSAPTTDPALVPHTRSILMLRASSALITPMCAKPRAAPPPSASPTRNGRCGLITGGGGLFDAVLGVGVTFSGLLPVDAQAERTAEAAAIEKVRRDRRGDDGFNEFSSDGAGVHANALRRVSCKDDRRWRS
ncbi:hypothetical protein BN2476_320192 [Paraburkholderia piptadeniae]|uniref:Uncharacterized protein n=1 Tax=Paraburkholderia piptadeniae TaxID=1701573 RepID=A0A1N7S5F4_9BURK|nr:hypothetical protein BN2476_320192 [Paraburkholderia piptadeniae]